MADALLSPAVGGLMYAASAVSVAYAARAVKKSELEGQKLPLMAVAGAFVFAAQMINFTIPGTGSSGHIGGGILLAGMLGGYPALLALAAVLVIQCLFFADGGLLALGANIFNMGVIPCLVVYPLLFKPLLTRRFTTGRLYAATILASTLGLELGALGVVAETYASGMVQLPFATFVTLMLSIHLVIGLVEGVVTAAVFAYVQRTRPEILAGSLNRGGQTPSLRGLVALLAVVALLVGGGLSLTASENPDGLEWSLGQVLTTTQQASGQVQEAVPGPAPDGKDAAANKASAASEAAPNSGSQAVAADETAKAPAEEQASGVHKWASSLQAKLAFLPGYDFAGGEGRGTSLSGILGGVLTCLLIGGAGLALAHRKR